MKKPVVPLGTRDIFFVTFGMILVGCVSVSSFPYKHYDPSFASYDGTLLGPTERDDIPASRCQPTESVKHPCVMMLASDFFKMKTEFIERGNQLETCQKP